MRRERLAGAGAGDARASRSSADFPRRYRHHAALNNNPFHSVPPTSSVHLPPGAGAVSSQRTSVYIDPASQALVIVSQTTTTISPRTRTTAKPKRSTDSGVVVEELNSSTEDDEDEDAASTEIQGGARRKTRPKLEREGSRRSVQFCDQDLLYNY